MGSISNSIRNAVSSPLAGGGGGPDPAITVQPTDQTVALGETATFTVMAEGTEPITYQWWERK